MLLRPQTIATSGDQPDLQDQHCCCVDSQQWKVTKLLACIHIANSIQATRAENFQVALCLLCLGPTCYLYREASCCCLSRKHDAIWAIKDCVGNISSFCTSGPRILHHAFQHLSRCDDWLARLHNCWTSVSHPLFSMSSQKWWEPISCSLILLLHVSLTVFSGTMTLSLWSWVPEKLDFKITQI